MAGKKSRSRATASYSRGSAISRTARLPSTESHHAGEDPPASRSEERFAGLRGPLRLGYSDTVR